MTDVFVDSGAWIALLRRNDRLHGSAAEAWGSLQGAGARFVTTGHVISESATRLRDDVGLTAALAFRDRVDLAAERGLLQVVWVDEDDAAEGWRLMERYADLALSFTDATSAAVATRLKVTEVFGFDADFRAMGFVVHPSV